MRIKRKAKKTARIQGRTSLYNPLLQKPIALHPVGPGSYPAGYGGYSYIGPPPDFGGTYGKFTDTAGREQVGIKSSKMFSIYDGTPTQFQAELSEDERQALLSQMDAAIAEYKCESCRSMLAISAVRNMEDVFCPHCGTAMSGAAEKVKQCVSTLEELKMGVEKNAIEAKAKKSKSNVDVAKEAMKKEAPGVGQDLSPDAAELKEHGQKVEKQDPMKELAKDLVKAQTDEKAQVLAKKKERMKAAVASYRAKRKAKLQAETDAAVAAPAAPVAPAVAAPVAAPVAEAAPAPVAPAAPAVAKVETAEQVQLRRELRIMAALDPKKFAAAKKNPKLAKICAEVETKIVSKADRIKVRTELKVLAAEDAVAAEELSKQLDFIAPEILMEEEVSVEPKSDDAPPVEDEKKEESAVEEHPTLEADKAAPAGEEAPKPIEEKKKEAASDELPVLEEDGALAMQTEFLASVDTLKGERIEMSLYNEQSENPFWNVVVDGEPVGRVYLQDQQNPDNQNTIRSAFCSDGYAKNFGNAASSVGLKKLLTITKARLFAHNVDDASVSERIREKAKLEAKAEMNEKLSTLRADFMKAVSLAMVAADKNFYQEEAGHKLKEGLFNSLVQAGLNEDGAVWAIEAGFEHSNDYFEFLMAKAQEIMDMPSQAREAIEKQILGSGKMQIAVEAPQEDDLASRLVKSSVKVIAMGGQLSGENRDNIRSQLGLNANRK